MRMQLPYQLFNFKKFLLIKELESVLRTYFIEMTLREYFFEDAKDKKGC